MVPSWVFLAERGRASLLLNFRTIQDLPPWTYRLPRWQAERAVIRGGGGIHVLPHELPDAAMAALTVHAASRLPIKFFRRREPPQNRPPHFPARASPPPQIVSDQISGDGAWMKI